MNMDPEYVAEATSGSDPDPGFFLANFYKQYQGKKCRIEKHNTVFQGIAP
jgi:hypothetical protein